MIWKTVNRFNQKIVLVKRRQWIMLLEHDKFAKCSSFDLSWESFKEVRSEEVSRRSFQGRGFKKIKTDFAKRQPVCRVDNVRPLSCYSHPLRSLSFIRCVSLAAYHSLRITRLHYSRQYVVGYKLFDSLSLYRSNRSIETTLNDVCISNFELQSLKAIATKSR